MYLKIAVLDTLAQLNPMPNLFILGYLGDGEGMVSCPRAQGWELKYLKDKKGPGQEDRGLKAPIPGGCALS